MLIGWGVEKGPTSFCSGFFFSPAKIDKSELLGLGILIPVECEI